MSSLAIIVALLVAAFAVTGPGPASVQLGPRPFYLLDRLAPGSLKHELDRCAQAIQAYRHHDFSIGHRGAALQFPEHTRESYLAARRMGAGILECDVTFTGDGQLVCRHAQCDLHATTNILLTPLAERCSTPFTPARFDADGSLLSPATARCCASALTLAEFKSLRGKMDAFDPRATTAEAFVGGTAGFRTDLYASGGTLMSHADSIELFDQLGAGFIPELKRVTDGFAGSGLTRTSYARRMIRDYIEAGIEPDRVFAQSFELDDVLLWVDEFPEFGARAVYLGAGPTRPGADPPGAAELEALRRQGVNILGVAMPLLLTLDAGQDLVASAYARRIRHAGLDLMAWTTERSGRIVEDVLRGGNRFYYGSVLPGLTGDGDILRTIDVLAREAGVIGIFSDWPATTTFYANCLDPQTRPARAERDRMAR